MQFLSSVITGRTNIPDSQVKYTLDNDTLVSVMDHLHKVNMDPEFSLEIPCPHIAVIGDQGLGKSTTLNRLLGAEILPMRQSSHESSICTLFPTIYHTIFDGECKDYHIEIWCKKQGCDEQLYDSANSSSLDDIKALVKSKFSDFYVKNGKDDTIIMVRVVVKGAKLASKYVVDLPGIRNDKSQQSIKISDQIVSYLDGNPGAIILFFLPSSGPERTSAWAIVNKYTSTHTIIPVLIRPDELGTNDRSVMNILTGKTDIKLPNDNVFVVKNPNTLNNEVFDITKADTDELAWFRKHPIYARYALESPFNKKFGFIELANKIIQVLNAKYCVIIPKVVETAEVKLQNYRLLRSQLKTKLIINESNKLLIYKSYIDEFLKRIHGVINGEVTYSKLSGSNIKSKIKEFCDAASSVSYMGKFNIKDIDEMVSQCGGSRDLYTKFSEEILINVLFKEEKSAAKQLDILIRQFIEGIVKTFRDIILDIDFSNSQIDQHFWVNMKEKLIGNVDKKYVIDGLNMLCIAQEAYFEFEDEKGSDRMIFTNIKSDESSQLSPGTKYVLNIMEQIWSKYLNTIKLQFGKYIQKHFVEYNLSELKMDNIYYNQLNIEQLTKFLKEPDDVEKRREHLDKNIDKFRVLLEIINKIRV
jgi:hypothetical protein